MSSLDRSKPYGTISGHDKYGFEQDGKYFDFDGNAIGGEKNAPAKPVEVKKNAPAPTAVDEQLAKQ